MNFFNKEISPSSLKRFLKRKLKVYKKYSYSQCGEDLIIDFLFETLKIKYPTYLDLGAHHPCYLSNTYRFYRTGSVGVNIEADPALIGAFKKIRPRDQNINVGIGPKAGFLDLYVMSVPTLNTFSLEEAERFKKESGFEIIKKVSVEVLTFDKIVSTYCQNIPDFVSLDVEGLDLEIIKSIDFKTIRPKFFCIETVSYSETRGGVKNLEIDKIFYENGYFKYADTFINSIYVDKQIWNTPI